MLTNGENNEEPQIHVLEIAGNALIGGMEKYVYNMAHYLPAHNFKVSCMTPYESAFTASLRDQGSDVFVAPMDHDPRWRAIQFTTELVRYQKINLIHAHLPRAHVLAGLVGKITNIPVVATVHGMDVTAQELGISRTTGTYLTVVCQDAFAQALSLGIPPERLALIPNGVDTKLYGSNRSGDRFRKALHIPLEAPLVGYVGRVAWEKGPDQFIQMAGLIHAERPDVHFVVVGEGPMEKEITQMIIDMGLAGCVHMAGLWTNTWEVFPALDIQVLPSRVEGMPFALLEGMASGRPVAAMSVGGVGEMVEVGTTGLVSAAGDWEGLANAVLKMLANPERMKAMGQAARKRAEEAYDLRDSVQSMANLFRRTLGKKVKLEKQLQTNWGFSGSPVNERVVIEHNAIVPKRS